MNQLSLSLSVAALILGTSWTSWAGSGFTPDEILVQRGRYVVKTTGCNDCHSPGYAENNGNLPEQRWLTGNPVGYKGPWGTSYPVNLRKRLASITESEWVSYAKTFKALPPMPWFNVNAMTTEDLRGIYHFVRHLGDNNTQIPEPLAPGVQPTTPYIDFTVVMPGT
jgi:mono/diheme cytochrome c family protein